MNKEEKGLLHLSKTYIIKSLIKELPNNNIDTTDSIAKILCLNKNELLNIINLVINKSITVDGFYSQLNNLVEKSKNIILNSKEKIIITPKQMHDHIENTLITISSKQQENNTDIKIKEEENKVLNIYKELSKELNINNTLDLSNFFTYLLWNGYFSQDKTHIFDDSLNNDNNQLKTIPVFKGRGTCLNYSTLQSNFLNICGKKATPVGCKLKISKIKKDEYKPDIKREFVNEKSNIILLPLNILLLPLYIAIKPILDKKGNHAITLINGEKGFYYYDPTNLLVLTPTGPYKAKIVNGTGSIKMEYDSTKINFNNDDIKLIISNYLNEVEQESITREEFIESMEKILELVKEKNIILDSAYSDAKKSITTINEETNNIKIKKR